MSSDDPEQTPPRGTPRPMEFWPGILPDRPPSNGLPKPAKVWASRPSQPPPVPESARKKTPFPSPIAPPPLPGNQDEDDSRETTDPSIRTNEFRKKEILQILRAFYPDEKTRLEHNGNSRPVLQAHLNRVRDDIIMRLESQSLYFFKIPMKWVALAATVIAICAGGLAIHSCGENKKLEQRIEQLENGNKEVQDLKSKVEQVERAKPAPARNKIDQNPTSTYIPKALNRPPQVPNRIPQKLARNSIRA
jgi:hypothetical protein